MSQIIDDSAAGATAVNEVLEELMRNVQNLNNMYAYAQIPVNISGNEKSWWEKRHEKMEEFLEYQVFLQEYMIID